MIRENMVAALLHERPLVSGAAMWEATSILLDLCRDGMTDLEIGTTLDRLAPMMRHELIDCIRAVALKVGIVLPPIAAAV